MKPEGRGLSLRIYIGESDVCEGKNLYVAIVQAARKRGLTGATVARGIMGFGARSAIHKPRLLSLSQDAPLVIEIVDSEEKICDFLPVLDEMVTEGMIMTSEVEIMSCRAGK